MITHMSTRVVIAWSTPSNEFAQVCVDAFALVLQPTASLPGLASISATSFELTSTHADIERAAAAAAKSLRELGAHDVTWCCEHLHRA